MSWRAVLSCGSNRRGSAPRVWRRGPAVFLRRGARGPGFFWEEGGEPMISGLRWVSELVEAAGGDDVFPQISSGKSAEERIVTADQVIAAKPDIIIGSWCGKKFVPAKVVA